MKTKKRHYTTKKMRMRKTIIKGVLIVFGIYFITNGVFQMGIMAYHYLFDFPEFAIAEVNYKKEPQKIEFIELTKDMPVINEFQNVEMQIREIAKEHNFKWPDYLIKLSMCESTLNKYPEGDNENSFGPYHIHLPSHPTVSEEEARDIKFSTKWTMQKINAGYQRIWSCDKIVKGKSLEDVKRMRGINQNILK